jgi:ABC-type transport system involved in multi-copper enzyme maturation permease subunit
MLKPIERIWALARIIILDGMRRHALLGLVAISLAAEAGGLLFFDFISRDIGRASSDFIFSISWLSGFIFLFFHAVQIIAWDEERYVIHTLLSRPISRGEYVIGVFTGLGALLLLLNLLLGILGWFTLILIKHMVSANYFAYLSHSFYLLTWFGLFAMELMILSIIMLFSGMVRGGFPVLLMSMSFYAICSGLPVVRESLERGQEFPTLILRIMTAIFPDFSRLDFKSYIVSTDFLPDCSVLFASSGLAATYVVIILWLACAIYKRRDLQ